MKLLCALAVCLFGLAACKTRNTEYQAKDAAIYGVDGSTQILFLGVNQYDYGENPTQMVNWASCKEEKGIEEGEPLRSICVKGPDEKGHYRIGGTSYIEGMITLDNYLAGLPFDHSGFEASERGISNIQRRIRLFSQQNADQEVAELERKLAHLERVLEIKKSLEVSGKLELTGLEKDPLLSDKTIVDVMLAPFSARGPLCEKGKTMVGKITIEDENGVSQATFHDSNSDATYELVPCPNYDINLRPLAGPRGVLTSLSPREDGKMGVKIAIQPGGNSQESEADSEEDSSEDMQQETELGGTDNIMPVPGWDCYYGTITNRYGRRLTECEKECQTGFDLPSGGFITCEIKGTQADCVGRCSSGACRDPGRDRIIFGRGVGTCSSRD